MESASRDLHTVDQAASWQQASPSSIRSYIRQGDTRAYRVARKRRALIWRDDLLKFLEPARPEDSDTDDQ